MDSKIARGLTVLIMAGLFFFINIHMGLCEMTGNDVSWGVSYKKDGIHYIPGTMQTDKGTMSLLWKISPGSSGLFLINWSTDAMKVDNEERLFVLYSTQYTAIIFRERNFLADSNQIDNLSKVASLKIDELFTAWEKPVTAPIYGIPQEQPITWGSPYEKNWVSYVPGTVQTDFGTFNFLWKRPVNGNPQLVFMESAGGGELPPREVKLLVYSENGKSFILQEILPQYKQIAPPYLRGIAVVKTTDLELGLTL